MPDSNNATNGTAPLDELMVQVESLAARELELRRALLRLSDQFQNNSNGSQATQPPQTAATLPHSSRAEKYARLVPQIQQTASRILPAGATVLVVSKGDDRLVTFDRQAGWHFPQNAQGIYAGHYPADSAAAIEHLEMLRAKGAAFIVFPNTAFWWLEYYQGLRQHLGDHYQCILRDEHSIIYALTAPDSDNVKMLRLNQLWSRVRRWLPGRQSKSRIISSERRVYR